MAVVSVRRRLVTLGALALCLAASLGTVAPAVAATPGEITNFEVPGICYPAALGAAPGGGVLARRCATSPSTGYPEQEGGTLATVLPSGAIESRAVPTAACGPALAGSGGEVWVAANRPIFQSGPVAVERIAADGSAQRFPLAAPDGGRWPRVLGLAPGDDGSVWAAIGEGEMPDAALGGSVGGGLVRVAPDGTQTTVRLPHHLEPWAVTRGPDGSIWFVAVRGRNREEHFFDPGVGFVGRVTEAGQLSIFRIPGKGTVSMAIAAGPDGTLWFTEPEASRVGRIGVDGTFGRSYKVRAGGPRELVFGPEGDAWTSGFGGIVRITRWGQQTTFGWSASQLVVGAEGDIWGIGGTSLVSRMVPGAPGLDAWGVSFDPRARQATVRLACGGSPSGCDGSLTLGLPLYWRRYGGGIGGSARRDYTFARHPYSVPAESEQSVTVPLPAKALRLAALRQPRRTGLVVHVQATVAGGPELDRRVSHVGGAQASYSASSTK